MCGISVIIDQKERSVPKVNIVDMTDSISHRGPDGHGYFFDDTLALGHRRLSIIDLSEAGAQPMTYMDRYTVTYNGEVYNYIELREELLHEGYAFKGQSDTEVLLAAYDFWGKDFILKLNGMWAMAIYDKKEKILFCSRDRYGIKPFFYTTQNNKFLVASEIKQFMVLDGWNAVLNNSAAIDFLKNGYLDHTNECFFENVLRLPAGCNLVYDLKNNQYNLERYYDLSKVKSDESRTNKEYIDEFQTLLRSSVDLRLRSDVKVGSALSGGLDSSSIVCIVSENLKKLGNESIQESVSYISDEKKFDESRFINAVVQQTGIINHKTYSNFKNDLNSVKEVLQFQDEPFTSSSIIAQYEVFKEANKNNLIVMLDGQGADEILAGYSKFYKGYFRSILRTLNIFHLISEFISYFSKHSISIGDIIRKLRSRFFGNDKDQSNWLSKEFIERYTSGYSQPNEDSIRNTTIGQLTASGLQFLLRYEDRNSMAHSIESRVPFLDYRLVNFTYSIKDNLKIKKAVRKYILREAMKDVIPNSILMRYDKLGFVTAQEKWMKSFPDLFKEQLKNSISMSKGIIDISLLKLFDEFIAGKNKNDTIFWRVIIFSLWLNIFDVTINNESLN